LSGFGDIIKNGDPRALYDSQTDSTVSLARDRNLIHERSLAGPTASATARPPGSKTKLFPARNGSFQGLTYDVHMTVIARVEDIPPRGIKFTYKNGPFDEEGILIRTANGQVRAFKNECRHLPMPLDEREPSDLWDDSGRHIVCSAHGARYRPADGLCVSGPCKGSHLKEVPLKISEGEVSVDMGATGSFFDV
jgi:nitrite reductase/ring-hydroxylating ferredoxin subunit